jgi:hypothetical protein
MKVISNTGDDNVIEAIRPQLLSCNRIDIAASSFSLFALESLMKELEKLPGARFILPPDEQDLSYLGTPQDRAARNRLQTRWLAKKACDWIEKAVEVKRTAGQIPQGALILQNANDKATQAVIGSTDFSTLGLGVSRGNSLSLIQGSETSDEAAQLSEWFEIQWASLLTDDKHKQELIDDLKGLAAHGTPSAIYASVLYHVLGGNEDSLDEEAVVKSATGIRRTAVWRKLYKFQLDGVIGAIDKLNRYGGCIIADSVGLGKTFEALAVIKYHELRNDRVLVLCPKRLRDNWTLYRSNDRRNVLAEDRLNYDVLNHTDLSRDKGMSGDIDLSHINWGNYDLIVIDESHNFRNKKAPRAGSETRYDRLMRMIIREGVKTRVLMLSATPVNNKLTDLRNQIAFVTEGDDTALANQGVNSIETTTKLAQQQFNQWLSDSDPARNPAKLVEMLGFDYFKLLDLLTIARSRKHIEKYYGTEETGKFPERLRPINRKADVDLNGEFPPIYNINLEIRRLNLATYAPLRYLLPGKVDAYDEKYSQEVKGGSVFRQVDREESLIHLMRVNVLKRMESSVYSFALTIERQLASVNSMINKIKEQSKEIEELQIEDIDLDDPTFESLLVGRKVKVLLQDMDLIRWEEDLVEDRNRLMTMLSSAREVDSSRDAKLAELKEVIANKCKIPINDGNQKVIIFTAFADTAKYLYEHIASWATKDLGVHSALVTGTGSNKSNLPGQSKDLGSILTSFAPRAKERPEDFENEGELEILIATDCISEGQNLQDCDFLVNYDIHWNPVRIIQRFGRIDRIGSPNERIQLVNFWPNMELEEYINLEQRVSGRMVLLDISATGEENLIEAQSGNRMNDLEYRRKQLLQLQDTVIDLEDLSSGISIADLTLTDFRIDLAEFLRSNPGLTDNLPLGVSAITTNTDTGLEPGTVFCLRAEHEDSRKTIDPSYPLSPHFLVHVSPEGAIRLGYNKAKQVLDVLKHACVGRDLPDATACDLFDKQTKYGKDMGAYQAQLAEAVASVVGKSQERAVESLFTPGGTHAMKGEFAGVDDFEVVAYLVILSEKEG